VKVDGRSVALAHIFLEGNVMKYLIIALLGSMLWVSMGCEAHGKVGDSDEHKVEIKTK
jgi:hypothetical protein